MSRPSHDSTRFRLADFWNIPWNDQTLRAVPVPDSLKGRTLGSNLLEFNFRQPTHSHQALAFYVKDFSPRGVILDSRTMDNYNDNVFPRGVQDNSTACNL